MTTLAVHSGQLTLRSLRALWRQPAFVLVTLVQPVIWLFLFGQLFSQVVEIPGFGADGQSYLEFLTPGVVMMTALLSAAWAGTVYIEDMERGVMDRLLASPVRRGTRGGATSPTGGLPRWRLRSAIQRHARAARAPGAPCDPVPPREVPVLHCRAAGPSVG